MFNTFSLSTSVLCVLHFFISLTVDLQGDSRFLFSVLTGSSKITIGTDALPRSLDPTPFELGMRGFPERVVTIIKEDTR